MALSTKNRILNFITNSLSFRSSRIMAKAVIVNFDGVTDSGERNVTVEPADFTVQERKEILSSLGEIFAETGVRVASGSGELSDAEYPTVHVGSSDTNMLPAFSASGGQDGGNAGFVFTTAGTTVSGAIDLIANEVAGLVGLTGYAAPANFTAAGLGVAAAPADAGVVGNVSASPETGADPVDFPVPEEAEILAPSGADAGKEESAGGAASPSDVFTPADELLASPGGEDEETGGADELPAGERNLSGTDTLSDALADNEKAAGPAGAAAIDLIADGTDGLADLANATEPNFAAADSGGLSLLAAAIDQSQAVFVNSAWTSAGKTPATYDDDFTETTITLIYGTNAFASVSAAVSAKPAATAIYVVDGNFSSPASNANGIPIFVYGGTTTTIYGAGSSTGSNVTVESGTVTNLYGGGSGATTNGDVVITINNGRIANLYGGGSGTTTNGNITITIKNGIIANLYGAIATASTVNGNIGINISGGTVNNFHVTNSDTIYGNIDVAITGGLFTEHVYLAGYGGSNIRKNAGTQTGGNVFILIDGGTFSKDIYCGAAATNGTGQNVIDGDITITIESGVINGTLYLAGSGTNANSSTAEIKGSIITNIKGGNIKNVVCVGGYSGTKIGGNVELNISGGTFSEAVYCGASNINSSSAGIVYGDVKVNITGGYLATLYGSGLGTTNKTSYVAGDVIIDVSGGTVGALFGGGFGGSEVKQDVRITLSGDALVTGQVYLGGNNSKVSGDVYFTIKDNALCRGDVFVGSSSIQSSTYQVDGNVYVTLAGGTITNWLDVVTNVKGSIREVTVTKDSLIGDMLGATKITVQQDAMLSCFYNLHLSGDLLIYAANGLSLDIDGMLSIADGGTITIDATDFEMAANVYAVKLIEATAWSGSQAVTINGYTGERKLDLRIIGGSLYLLDAAAVIYVSDTYTQDPIAPYKDPFTKETVDLLYHVNAFDSVEHGLEADHLQPVLIYITGGTFGDTYTEGVITVMNDGVVTALYGGFDGETTVALGKDIELTVNGGSVGTIFGGGTGTLKRSEGSDLYDQLDVLINGGTVETIYGASAGNTDAWSNVYINGGSVGTVYGGSRNGSVIETFVSFSGGTIGTIYGGCEQGEVIDNVYIYFGGEGGDIHVPGETPGGEGMREAGEGTNSNTNNAYLSGNLYAGSKAGTGVVKGDAFIGLFGGSINGGIYAGHGMSEKSEKELTVQVNITTVNGTITGLDRLIFAVDAWLIVNSSWVNNGTTLLLADNRTPLTVTSAVPYADGDEKITYTNNGAITVNATAYVMTKGEGNENRTMGQLIHADKFVNGSNGTYLFDDGRDYYDVGLVRYRLAVAETGLFIITQGVNAYINSGWRTDKPTPEVYTGGDGVGYYSVNAFKSIGEATSDSYFTTIYVEGGSDYTGGEFRGVTAIIQPGTEVDNPTRFTGNVYGGMGAGSSAWAETTDLTIKGGEFSKKHAVGGNQINGASAQVFTTNLKITGGTNFGSIIGGHQILAGGADITTTSTLQANFEKGTASMVIGGNHVNADSSVPLTFTGSAATVITGGTISNFVMGADYILAGSMSRNGAVSLTISGGTFSNYVGGGLMFRGANSEQADISGNVQLTITGGTFGKNIYAGNLADNATVSVNTKITGNTCLTLNATDKVITINANVYAGSYGAGTVEGNANVIVSGLGDNLKFSGMLSGASQSATYLGDRGVDANFTYYVSGTKTLTFNAFTGDFNAGAVCFQTIMVTGDSAVNLTSAKTHLSAASVWSFEFGSSVNWEAGVNDFTGDTLNFNFDSQDWKDDLESWTAVSGSNATFCQGWDSAEAVNLGGVMANWNADIAGWATSEYKLTFAEENKSLIISKIA